MHKLLYPFIWLLKKSKFLSALSCQLTQLTGKSKYEIHPKHLVEIRKPWYFELLTANDIALDLGCGNGQRSLKIAKKCKKVIGIDYDDYQLEIANESATAQKISNITFLNNDLEKQLPFKNKSFDKILCLDVLEHLIKRKEFLLEVKRVLKPKGVAFITVPNKDTSWKKLQKKVGLEFYSDPDHKIEYSLKQIKNILIKKGFKIIKIKPIVFDTPLVGFIDLIGGISLNFYKKLSAWKVNKVKNNLDESIGFAITMKVR